MKRPSDRVDVWDDFIAQGRAQREAREAAAAAVPDQENLLALAAIAKLTAAEAYSGAYGRVERERFTRDRRTQLLIDAERLRERKTVEIKAALARRFPNPIECRNAGDRLRSLQHRQDEVRRNFKI